MSRDLPALGPLNSEPHRIRPPFEQKPGESADSWRARSHADRVAALMESLDGIELGTYDRVIIDWLAGWDIPVIGTVASLFYRARAVGGDR